MDRFELLFLKKFVLENRIFRIFGKLTVSFYKSSKEKNGWNFHFFEISPLTWGVGGILILRISPKDLIFERFRTQRKFPGNLK